MPENALQQTAGYLAIDHIAIAVIDLDTAVDFYCSRLGFSLLERRTVKGVATGMISAELELNGIKLVLCQGTEPSSQVTRLVSVFGPGVAHIAFAVADVHNSAAQLRNRGIEFDTSVIESPGIAQTFTARDSNSGLSFELIKRSGVIGFSQANIEKMFDEMESSNKF